MASKPARHTHRRAKILATLGPSSGSEEMLRSLIGAGLNGVRLNFSHGTLESHAALIDLTRRISRDLQVPIAIVQDLQGPKLRTADNTGGEAILLKPGQSITISTENGKSTPNQIHVNYKPLPNDVGPGDRILIDDGRIELSVLRVDGQVVHAKVVTGGELQAHKGLNLPGVNLSAPALTEKDQHDLKFGLERAVDMIAMSFVRRQQDVAELRERVHQQASGGLPTPIISKLERQEAIDHLAGILEASDGVMVARGDLGVEIAAEKVPSLQKRIISDANEYNRLVITATQMLESMIRNPRPTRAESSDVANAVFDGSDVLMLSGETAIGNYPLQAVETMDRIIRDAEAHTLEWGFKPGQDERLLLDDAAATTQAARDLAHDRQAQAIAVFTRSGRTALLMSKARPSMPILGFTPERVTYQRMALHWGVEPHLIPMADSVEEMIDQVEGSLLRTGQVEDGDRVVLVASLPVGAMGPANMTYLHTIGGETVSTGVPERNRTGKLNS
ncbi:MAG: pyruvate kinase [Anaerolineales bacterium]